MQVVDDERVLVSTVADPLNMRMGRIEIPVGMRDDVRVGGGPKQGGRHDARHGQRAEHRQGCRHPDGGPEPTRERVGDEPGGMGQGELRGEDGRPVLLGRRAAQSLPVGVCTVE